jgi:CDP-paratose 2-epimerase
MKVLITGGAGFIGFHTVRRFSSTGHEVTILDNLSRLGASSNLHMILQESPKVKFINQDISNRIALFRSLDSLTFDVVIHLAAQTAVTTSLIDPLGDFNSNAIGSLNILEWARAQDMAPILIYASTNKVYGSLAGTSLIELDSRYSIVGLKATGVDETHQLSLKSPYGCSKGYADQAFLDYFESFDIPTVVFRQSCIYGTFQYGVEDQGWVAWMALAALENRKIRIYGNGKQVRDLLFVDDLIDAYELAIDNIKLVRGKAFNIGGGLLNSVSILEYLEFISDFLNKPVDFDFYDSRVGDQRYFVSENSKLEHFLNWHPKISISNGLPKMISWIQDNRLPS